jgi:hypothetical protein
MIRAHRWCLCLGLTILPGSAEEEVTPRKPISDSRVAIRLYNYAEVPVGTLKGATKDASNIFLTAGSNLSWFDCPISDEDTGKFQACAQVRDPAVLVLRILPASMDPGPAKAPGVFGISSDISAHIFYPRVQDFARNHQLALRNVLAAVMAHELGHLLLGDGSHSFHGIMRDTWRPEDFQPARGSLLFTRQQADRIKKFRR